jgi:hypothetical protein
LAINILNSKFNARYFGIFTAMGLNVFIIRLFLFGNNRPMTELNFFARLKCHCGWKIYPCKKEYTTVTLGSLHFGHQTQLRINKAACNN